MCDEGKRWEAVRSVFGHLRHANRHERCKNVNAPITPTRSVSFVIYSALNQHILDLIAAPVCHQAHMRGDSDVFTL